MVRHPIYTGLIVAILATGVAVATGTSLLGALLISFGQWRKARMEEKFLSAELGPAAYGAYCRRVPMIVPFIRRFEA
jgi:protein-S-isoprenylcysteine O-methyltransferase Ste14